jgi:SAM-dependent methyltransferase
MSNVTDANLLDEAKAFDHQIDERIANGHIPDLRYCKPCDWFYNNPWRRPAYVQLDFGEQFEIIRDAILLRNAPKTKNIRVLEVGCGPGYLSLELARAGFDVVGLDISDRCIEIARRFADEDPLKPSRGSLNYLAGDFYSHAALQEASFDAVVFLGALHHFPEQDATLKRATTLLKPDGTIVVHEPARDRVTRGNAAFVHLLRVLLSAQNGFYRNHDVPGDGKSREMEIDNLFAKMKYELEDGQKVQSVNDNEAGYAEMYAALGRVFTEVHFEWRYAFFHELIGGLRFEESKNVELARYLRDMDKELCKLDVLSPTEFFYVGAANH